jgi:hypothetical protein
MLGVILATYVRLMPPGRVTLIADIHTKALRREGPRLLRPLIIALKRWALSSCAATVVTNENNARYAEGRLGVIPYILSDPLPSVPLDATCPPAVSADVVVICSFAVDEPLSLIREVAQRLLAQRLSVAITGDAALLNETARRDLQKVARLTGFLPDVEYWRLLNESRCIVVLSTEPACLPCGAYEAIALGRRPVLARDEHAAHVFGNYAAYTGLDPDELEQTILATTALTPCADSGIASGYHTRWEAQWAGLRSAADRDSIDIGCGA